MSDELRAAAERLIVYVDGLPCPAVMYQEAREIARAYLAHPPLTRERVAAAVAELFVSMNTKADRLLFADANNEDLGMWWREKGLTDRLCRLLGVVEGE
jgi:hypothetical protein